MRLAPLWMGALGVIIALSPAQAQQEPKPDEQPAKQSGNQAATAAIPLATDKEILAEFCSVQANQTDTRCSKPGKSDKLKKKK